MGKNYTAGPAEAPLSAVIPEALAGLRFDQALAKLFPQYSRSRLQVWLKAGLVSAARGASQCAYDGSSAVSGGERIGLAPPALPEGRNPAAQRMPLAVVFEDEDLIVLDKPAGLVVHPGAGNPDRTLMNALLAHAPALRLVPRAGIVHRLDKETSGLLVVAKNLSAQANLAAQLAARSVKRTYLALVHGAPPASGAIDAPVGRDTRLRTRMTVTRRGKEARTGFRVLERFAVGSAAAALLECRLDTGRTHQIRVHLQHIRHPVVGDPVYRRGARAQISGDLPFLRQALHAAELELVHPRSGKTMRWRAPLPADMKKLLATLRRGA